MDIAGAQRTESDGPRRSRSAFGASQAIAGAVGTAASVVFTGRRRAAPRRRANRGESPHAGRIPLEPTHPQLRCTGRRLVSHLQHYFSLGGTSPPGNRNRARPGRQPNTRARGLSRRSSLLRCCRRSARHRPGTRDGDRSGAPARCDGARPLRQQHPGANCTDAGFHNSWPAGGHRGCAGFCGFSCARSVARATRRGHGARRTGVRGTGRQNA